jgi:hypothetical protein
MHIPRPSLPLACTEKKKRSWSQSYTSTRLNKIKQTLCVHRGTARRCERNNKLKTGAGARRIECFTSAFAYALLEPHTHTNTERETTHTHTHTHNTTHTHTHTHTHAQTRARALSLVSTPLAPLPLLLSVCLFLNVTHPPHTTHSLSPVRSLALDPHNHLSLALSLTHTHTHTPSRSRPTQSHLPPHTPFSLTASLSLSHAPTHSHPLSL